MGSFYDDTILATSGLQSFWKLNETSGSSAADSKGSVTGTINGSITLGADGTGAIAPTMSSAGDLSADYIDCGNNYAFSGTAAMSIEAWVYPLKSTVSGRMVAKNKDDSPYSGWIFLLTGGKSYYERDKGDGTAAYYYWQGGTTLSVNTWYHVAVTYDSSASPYVKIYVNGTAETLTTGSGGTYAAPYSVGTLNVGNLTLFRGSQLYGVNARMGRVAIYNTTLSATTISNHYNAFKAELSARKSVSRQAVTRSATR